MVARLLAENAFEHAVAFAGDTVVAWAFIVVFLQRVVAVTLWAADFSFWYWAFPREMVHGVAVRALNNDGFVSAVNKLDLSAKHAHSLKCSTLCDGLILLDVRE